MPQATCQNVGVEDCDGALNQARILQPFGAAQAGRCRGVHALGQGLVAQTGILLELGQQGEVDSIKRNIHNNSVAY